MAVSSSRAPEVPEGSSRSSSTHTSQGNLRVRRLDDEAVKPLSLFSLAPSLLLHSRHPFPLTLYLSTLPFLMYFYSSSPSLTLLPVLFRPTILHCFLSLSLIHSPSSSPLPFTILPFSTHSSLLFVLFSDASCHYLYLLPLLISSPTLLPLLFFYKDKRKGRRV